MANRLTGEDRDIITSKITLAYPDEVLPGTGGRLVRGATATYPFNSEWAADIRARLADGMFVIRVWDVLWPADGSAPHIISETNGQ